MKTFYRWIYILSFLLAILNSSFLYAQDNSGNEGSNPERRSKGRKSKASKLSQNEYINEALNLEFLSRVLRSQGGRVFPGGDKGMGALLNSSGCDSLFTSFIEDKEKEDAFNKAIYTTRITEEDLKRYDMHSGALLDLYYERSLDIFPELNEGIETFYDDIVKNLNYLSRYRSRMSSIDKFKWSVSVLKDIMKFREEIVKVKIIYSQKEDVQGTTISLDVYYTVVAVRVLEEIIPTILEASDKDFSAFLDISLIYFPYFKILSDSMIPTFSYKLNHFLQSNKNHPNFYRIALLGLFSSYIVDALPESNLDPTKKNIPEYFYDVIDVVVSEDVSHLKDSPLLKYKELFSAIHRLSEVSYKAKELEENPEKIEEEKYTKYSDLVADEFSKILDPWNQRLFCWFFSFYSMSFYKYYTPSLLEGLRWFSRTLVDEGAKNKDIGTVENVGLLMRSLGFIWGNYIKEATSYEEVSVILLIYLMNEENVEEIDKDLKIKPVIFDNVVNLLKFLEAWDSKVFDANLVDEFIHFLFFQTTNVEEFIKISKALYSLNSSYYKKYISGIDIDKLIEDSSLSTIDIDSLLYKENIEFFRAVFSSPKSNSKIKQLYVSLLLNKKTLDLEDIYFLIENRKKFHVSEEDIFKYIDSLSCEDTSSFLLRRYHKNLSKKYQKKLLEKYLDISYLRACLENMNSNDYISFIYILLVKLDDKIKPNIIEILKENEELFEKLKTECVDRISYDQNKRDIKDFLISSGLVKKNKKVVDSVPKVEKVEDETIYAKSKKQSLKDRLIEFSLVNDLNAISKELKSYNLNVYESMKNDKKFLSDIENIISFFYYVDTTTDKSIHKNYIFNIVPFSYVIFLLNSLKTNDRYLALSIIEAKISQNNIPKTQLYKLIDIISDSYQNSSDSKAYRLYLLDFCIDLLKNRNLEFDDDCLQKYLNFIIGVESNYNVAFYERIKGLIDVIVRFNDRASILYDKLKSSLLETSSFKGINYFNIAMIEANINLAHLYSESSSVRKVIIASLLSDFCYIYLYNITGAGSNGVNVLNYDYDDVINDLKQATSYSVPFISKIAKDTLDSLSSKAYSFNLRLRIQRLVATFNASISGFNIGKNLNTGDSLTLREDISIAKIVLGEILKGRWVLDLSGKEYIGLGYDVLVMDDNGRNISLIEAKSKVSMSSSYPTYLSRTQLQKAKEVYEGCTYLNKTLKYHVILVPLKQEDVRKFGATILVNLDLGKIVEALRNSSVAVKSFDLSLLKKDTEQK